MHEKFEWKKTNARSCQSLEKSPPSPVTSDLFPLVVVNQEYVRQKEKRNSLLDFVFVEDFGGRMIRVVDFFFLF